MKYRGEWYTPERPDVKLSGMLIIEDGEHYLTLYSTTNFKGISVMKDADWDHDYEVILGSDFGYEITLINSRFNSADIISDSLATVTLKPSLVLKNVHAQSFETLVLKNFGCSFSYLSHWIDGQNSLHFLRDGESIAEWRLRTNKSIEIKISETLTIEVSRVVLTNSAKANQPSFSVRHYVDFNSTEMLSFERFEQLSNIFRRLISFAVQEPVGVFYHTGNTGVKHAHPILIFESKRTKKNYKEADAFRNQQSMLFDANRLGNLRLERIIKKWFDSFEKYQIVYDMYLDTLQWFTGTGIFLSTVVYNNRLLNLIQSLEAFYNVDHSEKETVQMEECKQKRLTIIASLPKADQKWANKYLIVRGTNLAQKIASIVDSYQYLFGSGFDTRKKRHDFGERIAGIRNALSHGRHKKTEEVYEYRNDYHICKVLITAAILDKLSFTQMEIKEIFNNSFDLARELRYILKYNI